MMPTFLTDLAAQGRIRIVRHWQSDSEQRIYFVLIAGQEHPVIRRLVESMDAGHVICFVLYASMEQYHYVYRTADGYEIQRAGHGSVGPRRMAAQGEAEAWLMDVADQNCEWNPSCGAPYFRCPVTQTD